MSDNTRLNPGEGGDLYAANELDTVNGLPAEAGLKVQRVKLGFGDNGQLQDVHEGAPLPTQDGELAFLMLRMLQLLGAPLGYDKALGRQRSTAIIESGTVTTVTTAGTVTNIGAGRTGIELQDNANRTAWALLHRARIT